MEGWGWESKVGKTPVITLYTAVAAQLPLSSAHNTTQQMIRPAATQELQLLREPAAPSEAEAPIGTSTFPPPPPVPNHPHMRPRGSASGGEPPRSVTAPVNRPKVSKAAFLWVRFYEPVLRLRLRGGGRRRLNSVEKPSHKKNAHLFSTAADDYRRLDPTRPFVQSSPSLKVLMEVFLFTEEPPSSLVSARVQLMRRPRGHWTVSDSGREQNKLPIIL